MSGTASMTRREHWQEIVDRLDLTSEYQRLGLRTVRQSGDKLVCRAMGREDRNPSAEVDLRTGFYTDHGGLGENLSLYEFAARYGSFADKNEAYDHYAGQVGLADAPPANGAAKANKKTTSPPRSSSPKGKQAFKTPDLAAKAYEKKNGPWSHRYDYDDGKGNLELVILRWDQGNGEKTFRQLSVHPDGCWYQSGVPGKNPLFNQKEIADSQGPVYVAEGEKAALALASIGVIATTSPQGSKSAAKANWQFLAGREVFICPDNDEEGAGYAKAVAKLLRETTPPATPKLVEIPQLPTKGDAADWLEAHDAVDPDELRRQLRQWSDQAKAWSGDDWTEELRPVSLDQLTAENPILAAPIIDGILRRGEVANIVSAAKIGKSWLVYGLAFSLSTGSRWLGHYQCERSRVLLIDYELQCPTLADRLKRVSAALGITEFEQRERIDVLSLRGRLKDLHAIKSMADGWQGKYDVIVVDAWYRALPADVDENSNGQITGLYNQIDSIAAKIGCGWINIHHSSKGAQGGKSVTDVGSGAGAQSRAADTHIILREHEDAGCAVLEAAVRSFAPVEPLPIRFDFPLWTADSDIDANAVKGRLTTAERKQREQDQRGKDAIIEALERDGRMTARKLRAAASLSRERLDRLAYQLCQEGLIIEHDIMAGGKPAKEFELRPSPSFGGEWAGGPPTFPPTLPLGD